MRSLPAIPCGLVLIAVFAAVSAPGANGQNATPPARLNAVLEGPRVIVFETPKDACPNEPNDIPDAMARAFRDSKGTVHLIAASVDIFQNLGPTLQSVQHNCNAAFRSTQDPILADYNDESWLTSFYTLDGITVAAPTHMEYHAWSFPGECNSQNIFQCEYDNDTYHQSIDGGYTFDSFEPPNNILAVVPYKYVVDGGPSGYSVDTNIIQWGDWYYAMTTAWTWPPNCGSQTGQHRCITSGGAPIRTNNVFDPSSWRGWSGTDFSVSFVDPYLGPVANPLEHVYSPVAYMGYVNAINIYQPANIVVATLWDGFDNQFGVRGAYLTTSTDLVNWTKPTLIVSEAQLLDGESPANVTYAYFSLLDPTAPDRNFSVIGNNPSLYFVRINNITGERVLFSQPIKLTAK